ncbi:stage III sporulation protein AF [Paenibacillus sp. YN15]|uniref:stage III sporulation protein AF n=1 Tax=Paenibacillus sp. YN15 TaxID=1742774 RepID=UPI000DCEDDD1|nr:stage III sporulation protein AF [Paenibacillus sp. YN15]RAV00977.1 stage III sporulation protein AF [Paenibacillus sp. YN15]
MIAWIREWLTQVILIILLASFSELLLPSQAMQRYVRVVVSLFLLLTLLTPVFELFTRQWDAEQVLAEAQTAGLKNGGLGPSDKAQPVLAPLAAVLSDAEKLKSEQAKEAQRLAEEKLGQEMKAGLARSAGIEARELAVTLEMDKTGSPVIGSVRVVLSHKEEAAQSEAESKSKVKPVTVEAVKPVTVSMDNAAGAPTASPKSAADTTAEANEARAECIRYMEKEWQVPRERLAISFAGAS